MVSVIYTVRVECENEAAVEPLHYIGNVQPLMRWSEREVEK